MAQSDDMVKGAQRGPCPFPKDLVLSVRGWARRQGLCRLGGTD